MTEQGTKTQPTDPCSSQDSKKTSFFTACSSKEQWKMFTGSTKQIYQKQVREILPEVLVLKKKKKSLIKW